MCCRTFAAIAALFDRLEAEQDGCVTAEALKALPKR
jgi:hypothetical protein